MARTSLDDPTEQSDLQRAFEQAGSGANVPAKPESGATVEVSDGVITARRVEVARNLPKILAEVKALAAAAGTDWFYRFPVWNNRKRRQEFIEGPSIKLANSILMLYGNAAVDCRIVEHSPREWMIYAKFVDYERGVSLVRPWLQDKGSAKLGGDDEGRKLNIALQIGVSKAERNAIVNGLQILSDFAFDEAQKNLVEKIGRNVEQYRARALKWFEENNVELKRVELVMGRASKEWMAPDLARLAAEVKAVEDGMSTVDETWPREPAPEPRRNDVAAGASPQSKPPEQPKGAAGPPADSAGIDDGHPPRDPGPPEARNWSLPADLLGQPAVLKALGELLGMTETDADVDALLAANADRVAKITGLPAQQWRHDVKARRDLIAAGRTEP